MSAGPPKRSRWIGRVPRPGTGQPCNAASGGVPLGTSTRAIDRSEGRLESAPLPGANREPLLGRAGGNAARPPRADPEGVAARLQVLVGLRRAATRDHCRAVGALQLALKARRLPDRLEPEPDLVPAEVHLRPGELRVGSAPDREWCAR